MYKNINFLFSIIHNALQSSILSHRMSQLSVVPRQSREEIIYRENQGYNPADLLEQSVVLSITITAKDAEKFFLEKICILSTTNHSQDIDLALTSIKSADSRILPQSSWKYLDFFFM